MPRLQPWTAATPEEFAAVFAADATRWRTTLAWDTRDLWPALERARTTGRLAGVLTRDDAGRISGWSWFAAREDDLQVGGIAAATSRETAALLDALLASPAAAAAGRVVVFAFSDAPGLDAALAARGFQSDPYGYLVRRLAPGRRPAAPGRLWDLRDLDATVDLLQASYTRLDPLRPFAPQGHASQWRQYVGDLVMGQGCGRFRPTLSLAVPADDGRLDAVALVTDLGERSAHLAQLVVRPSARGAGLGGALVTAVERQAAAAGFERLTLLVGGRNARALHLYEAAGFVSRASFTCAARSGARLALSGTGRDERGSGA